MSEIPNDALEELRVLAHTPAGQIALRGWKRQLQSKAIEKCSVLELYSWEDDALLYEQDRQNARKQLRRQTVERMVMFVLLDSPNIKEAMRYTHPELPRFPKMVDINRHLPSGKIPFKDTPPLSTHPACQTVTPDFVEEEVIVDMLGVIKNYPQYTLQELRGRLQTSKDAFVELGIDGWCDSGGWTVYEIEPVQHQPEGSLLTDDQRPKYTEYVKDRGIYEVRLQLEVNAHQLSINLNMKAELNKFMLEALEEMRKAEAGKRESSEEGDEGPIRKKPCEGLTRKRERDENPLVTMISSRKVSEMTDVEGLTETVVQQHQLIQLLCDQINRDEGIHTDDVDRLLKREYQAEQSRKQAVDKAKYQDGYFREQIDSICMTFYDQERKRNSFLTEFQDTLSRWYQDQIRVWWSHALHFTDPKQDQERLNSAHQHIKFIAENCRQAAREVSDHTHEVLTFDYDTKEAAVMTSQKAEHEAAQANLRARDAEAVNHRLREDITQKEGQLDRLQ